MYANAFILTSAQKLGELQQLVKQGQHHKIGTKIEKKFYEDTFQGEISAVLSPEIGDTSLWYQVVYEDGDEETMDTQEINPLIIHENHTTTNFTSAAVPAPASAPIDHANASAEDSASASARAIPGYDGRSGYDAERGPRFTVNIPV